MMIGRTEGHILRLFVHLLKRNKPTTLRVLEIGTFTGKIPLHLISCFIFPIDLTLLLTGFSSLWMGEKWNRQEVAIDTIELDPKNAQLAQSNFSKASDPTCYTIHNSPAIQVYVSLPSFSLLCRTQIIDSFLID
jgi:hypothetical protein